MNRRDLLRTVTLAFAPLASHALPPPASRTRWVLRGSEGFDALGFMAPLSGDPFYVHYYEKAVAEFAPRIKPETITALRELKRQVTETDELLSPFFYLPFSAGPDASIDDLLHSLDHAERILKAPFRASPYWQDDGEGIWKRFIERGPVLRSILVDMRDAGFPEFRRGIFEPIAAQRLPRLREHLAATDVIAEVERFTGRRFDPEIEVALLVFSKPHGVKVIGQKFLTGIDYPDKIAIQTAVHELLHPPVDMHGRAAKAALAVLNNDPLLKRVLAERNTAYGYGSVEALLNEDLVKSVDQVISERLGVGDDPAERFAEQDEGMHILAAGFYGLLRQTGYARTGGNLERWLLRAASDGLLAPPSLHRAAAVVLKRSPDALWIAPRKPV
jgi:hypothetical protein